MKMTTISTEIVIIGCGECGGPIALTKRQQQQLKDNHKTFYCPVGHSRYYPALNEAEQLRADLEQELEYSLKLKSSNDDLLLKLSDQNKELKRVNRRAEVGVCQKCHRTFVNVQRHMATKHGVA